MRKMGWMVALAVVPALALAENQPQGQTTQQMGKQEAVQQFRAEDGLFSSPNYDIEGRISSVSGDSVTITREDAGLPAAELSIASNTKIELDGNTASAQQLREGQQVRAKFNLQREQPVALELSAERQDRQRAGGTAPGLGGQPLTVGSGEVGGEQGEPGAGQQEGGREQVAPGEQQAAASGEKAKKSVVGTVQSVEEDKLSLKNKLGETHEFSLGDDTRFTRGGQAVSKDQIAEGDEIRAAFRGEEGNLEATEIILMDGERSQGESMQPGQQDQGQQQQR